RFRRLAELSAALGNTGALSLVQSDEKGVAFNVWLDPLTPADATNITEVLDLLGLPKREDDSKSIVTSGPSRVTATGPMSARPSFSLSWPSPPKSRPRSP
ncbi:MAG TPA: hypothetical protein VNM68_10005, partial [Candidatus Polarisedimenticolia bacterium]|nr:hypothetical protein [Candidatus Polarisedimenticolia bacterium]